VKGRTQRTERSKRPTNKEVLCTQLMKLGIEYRQNKSWGILDLMRCFIIRWVNKWLLVQWMEENNADIKKAPITESY